MMDEALSADVIGDKVARIKIWSRDRRIVYSDAKGVVGRRFPPSDDLAEALDGHLVSEVSQLDSAENVGEHAPVSDTILSYA